MWGGYITTFVFWVGIAHSGTLISAVLYLFRAHFRMPIYRVAEAMTVFAVLTAGLFPLIHLGRVWYFYWLMPYPNERAIWPNFRSPLLWDVFAVSTYLTISDSFLTSPLLATVRRLHLGKSYTKLLPLGGQGIIDSGSITLLLTCFSQHSQRRW
jgi:molybdopterin-containing oxidoreductase family membrane subunit